MREWLTRMHDWMRRDRLDAELDEELAFHRAQLERDARAAGATPDEAAWAARRALGSTLRAKALPRRREVDARVQPHRRLQPARGGRRHGRRDARDAHRARERELLRLLRRAARVRPLLHRERGRAA